MPDTERRYVVTRDLKLAKQEIEVVLNANRQVRCNEVTTNLAKATCKLAASYVGYVEIDEETCEAVLLEEKVDGAVKIRWGAGHRTASFSFGPMLVKHPALKVGKGAQRVFKCRLDAESSPPRFLIQLSESEVRTVERRGKAKAAPVAAAQQPPAPEAK
jgi:3'-phosphoadenosine 5'-phosphosulfate sulfotransferase